MIKLRKTAAIMLAAALAICVGATCGFWPGGSSDVPASAWYNDAVGWAVEEGVAEGTGDGIFSPDAGCIRAQIVTFIWRMAGSPEPSETSDAFHDLPEDAYYYDAMLWANEKGIISGTSEVTLSPDGPCTRAQAVTMLWRYAGADEGYTGDFTDVPETAYYYQAVGWAIKQVRGRRYDPAGIWSGFALHPRSNSNDALQDAAHRLRGTQRRGGIRAHRKHYHGGRAQPGCR